MHLSVWGGGDISVGLRGNFQQPWMAGCGAWRGLHPIERLFKKEDNARDLWGAGREGNVTPTGAGRGKRQREREREKESKSARKGRSKGRVTVVTVPCLKSYSPRRLRGGTSNHILCLLGRDWKPNRTLLILLTFASLYHNIQCKSCHRDWK